MKTCLRASNPGRPSAVTGANGLAYTYDANGRMITRGSDDITWTSFDKPKKIESGSDYTEFT